MKRFVSILLSTLIILGALTSCSNSTTTETTKVTETSEATTTQETTAETTEETVVEDRESHYTFNPYVCSTLMTEIMGEEMRDTYFNLVDCVLAGETTFECPDEATYDWVMGQFPYLCFPVIREYVIRADGISYENGVGRIQYTIPYEEFEVKLQEFEDLTVSILNETLEDDYSDFEKALALYQYFVATYEYDYYAADHIGETEVSEMISGYRLLTEGIGICQEISVAYSFLLLEAGVDASVMKGERGYDNVGHQWSLVKIDGKYYHIDPTYGLGFTNSLEYFMMTDQQRFERDDYDPACYVPCTVYAQNHETPDCSCTDDTYRLFWVSTIISWSPDENRILCEDYYGIRHWFEYGDV